MAASDSCVERTISFLKNLLSTFPDINILDIPKNSIPVRRKLRDLGSGDIVLPKFTKLDSRKNDELLQFVQLRVTQGKVPVAKVLSDEHNLLTIYLKHNQVFQEVVTEVQTRGSKYGVSEVRKDQTVFLSSKCNPRGKCTTDYRRSLITAHVANLLKANGYNVRHLHEDRLYGDVSGKHSSVKEREWLSTASSELHPCDLDLGHSSSSNHPRFVSKVKTLLSDQDTKETQDGYLLHVKRIIKEHKLVVGRDGIDKNLEQVQVFTGEGEASEILREAVSLEDELDHVIEKMGAVNTCMHICSQQKTFKQQQVLLLSVALSEKHCHQSQLIVGPVMCKKEGSMDDFYRTRYDQMKQASEMRYGQKCEGVEWESRLHLLTRAGLVFDFMGTASHAPLHLDMESSGSADSRKGAFVLYNTARLASLLRHFSQEVDRGTYPPLPAIDSVDFALLREQEDWELAFLYIAAFPVLVRDSVEMVSSQDGRTLAKIHTHKVVNFLSTFCKSLSSYYNRYHILGGGESHLLPLMHARLYLMQAAHQVLVNALQLLDIQALDQL